MTPTFDNGVVRFYQGDVREVLRELPPESVQTCVTSPPYWGLRDYGLPPLVWGGDEDCEHEWGEEAKVQMSGGGSFTHSTLGFPANGGTRRRSEDGYERDTKARTFEIASAFCACGAWRGCLGLEPTIDLYVEHMVEVFREVRRVLRDDGTVWLNLGDSYAQSTTRHRGETIERYTSGGAWKQSKGGEWIDNNRSTAVGGLKPKDLCGIPWRVAFALQADGWWLRSDIVWSKPNPMPESVTDRPTRAHEYVFLLSKSARYYYDADAIRESLAPGTLERPSRLNGQRRPPKPRYGSPTGLERPLDASGRNKRTVWEIATEPYPDAHFATFPQKLVEPCILAGCPTDALVLDPFVGSGTTAFVAQRLGRRAIGIDLSEDYLVLAEKRLRGQTLPMTLP